MTEGEQVYTALELAMNAAGARFFEVPFRPSSYFSNRLTSVVTMEYVDLRSATISSSCKAGHARRSGGYGEMFQRSRKEKEGWRWVMNFMVTTLTLAIDQLNGWDAIPVGFLLCFLREATGGEDQPFLGTALHTAAEVADQGGGDGLLVAYTIWTLGSA